MRQLVKEKENSEFKPVKLCLKIDLESYPAQAERVGKWDNDVNNKDRTCLLMPTIWSKFQLPFWDCQYWINAMHTDFHYTTNHNCYSNSLIWLSYKIYRPERNTYQNTKKQKKSDSSKCYVPPSGQTNDNTEFVYNNIYLFSRRTLVWSRSSQERN